MRQWNDTVADVHTITISGTSGKFLLQPIRTASMHVLSID